MVAVELEDGLDREVSYIMNIKYRYFIMVFLAALTLILVSLSACSYYVHSEFTVNEYLYEPIRINADVNDCDPVNIIYYDDDIISTVKTCPGRGTLVLEDSWYKGDPICECTDLFCMSPSKGIRDSAGGYYPVLMESDMDSLINTFIEYFDAGKLNGYEFDRILKEHQTNWRQNRPLHYFQPSSASDIISIQSFRIVGLPYMHDLGGSTY